MNKDEALKLALEALEWSYGGEPMPTKEAEAIKAIRQALAEWTPDDTAYRPDGLSQEELIKISSDYLMHGMAFMKAGKHVPVDEVIDRGAWSDVPNATKWVDDLRGDEPKREWVGLTNEEREDLWQSHIKPLWGDMKGISPTLFACKVEAKLKEKNT